MKTQASKADRVTAVEGSLDRSVGLFSFQEWNEKGFKINRGEKASEIKNGEAFFHAGQVYDPNQLTIAHEDWLVRSQKWEEMPH